jgi:hypothetical protein
MTALVAPPLDRAASLASKGSLQPRGSGFAMLSPAADDPSDLDAVPDVPFSELCHDGVGVTSKNWLVKLWRYTIVPTKELYLPFVFTKMPTNYLMVRKKLFAEGVWRGRGMRAGRGLVWAVGAKEGGPRRSNRPGGAAASGLCAVFVQRPLRHPVGWFDQHRCLLTSPPAAHPTTPNRLQLTYRTFNRDFGLPNCNDDYLAPLLRDELMPERGRMHRERSEELWYRNRILDLKYLGVPGEGLRPRGSLGWWWRRRRLATVAAAVRSMLCCRCTDQPINASTDPPHHPAPGIVNFIDARTQWIDEGMTRALDDGIKQVGGGSGRRRLQPAAGGSSGLQPACPPPTSPPTPPPTFIRSSSLPPATTRARTASRAPASSFSRSTCRTPLTRSGSWSRSCCRRTRLVL